jgi:protein TonB
MKTRLTLPCIALAAAACTTPAPETPPAAAAKPVPEIVKEKLETPRTTPDAVSTAGTLEAYKLELARRIAEVNSTQVYTERPQALLRSVIVVKYYVDREGRLAHSEIMRSNRDKATEATALGSLRRAAPFPLPGKHLLQRGRVELAETWLFNKDGRFQLRTLALPQMNE